MAGRSTIRSEDSASAFLDSNQQTLLLAALNSLAPNSDTSRQSLSSNPVVKRSDSDPAMSAANDDGLFISPQDATLDNFDDYTPDLDYLDGDGFDFENADLGGEMIGALPGDGHDKRKSPDDNAGDPEGDAKRQETQEGEKTAKKPGRKPLTSEPTTKRKAQNRAAQRAFRERKEKHLKDLETKVTELTKTQEADKHENGLLKAQVERLQIELREYRKRLSLNSSATRGSPPLNAVGSQQRSNSGPANNGGFQFDFPKFGALPGSQLFGSQNVSSGTSPSNKAESMTPPLTTQSPTNMNGYGHGSAPQSSTTRHNSTGRSLSPQSGLAAGPSSNMNAIFAPYSTNDNMHGFASTLPQMANDALGDLFSPGILKSANVNEYFNNEQSNASTKIDNGGDSTAGLNRVFQFNASSNVSDTTSPSASSSSQWNANGNSSCGTSPEPSHDSPALKDNKQQSQTPQVSVSNAGAGSQSAMDAMFGLGNSDFNVPSLNSFDPVLFGDYRDSNEAIVGGGAFSGGFFDDALNSASFDYGSPSNLFGILQSPQQTHTSLNSNNNGAANAATPSRNLMAEIEKTRDGGNDDYGLPSDQGPSKESNGRFVSCNSIWNQLQSNPDFQDGKFDLDNLCSELRMKAKCSESGVMVDQDHVNAALKKLGQKDDKVNPFSAPGLMFEQDSWDAVLKKLQDGNRM